MLPMHCLTHQQVEGGCVRWPITGDHSVSLSAAAWRKPPLPTSHFGLIRPQPVSGPSDAPITVNTTDNGAVKTPMRSQCPLFFDWPVCLCSLTYQKLSWQAPLGARHVEHSSPDARLLSCF